MSTPTSPTKKQRALPRVWARFFSLKSSSTFTHGGKRFYKSVVPCLAIQIEPSDAKYWLFFPWERVQTDVLVRDAKPGGKSSKPVIHAIVADLDRPRGDEPNNLNNVSGPTS